MDRTKQFNEIQKRLNKIETYANWNRLLVLGSLILTFHSFTCINTEKQLKPVHYAGFAGCISGVACAFGLQNKKQKYEDKWHQLQREG